MHEQREELQNELRLRRLRVRERVQPVAHEVRRQRVGERTPERGALEQNVRQLHHRRELVRLAASEQRVQAEADDVQEAARVENRQSLAEVRAHLRTLRALEQRQAPHAIRHEPGGAAELAFAETLGLGRLRLRLLRVAVEVGDGPEQRLHADHQRLDQRLGVREALERVRGGLHRAVVPDERLRRVLRLLGVFRVLRVLRVLF